MLETRAQPETDSAPPQPPARRRVPRKTPLSAIPRHFKAETSSVIDRALHAFAPWERHDYPGKWRVWREITGLTPHALRAYRRKRCKASAATLERMEAFLMARRNAIDSAIAELQAAKAAIPPRRNTGICAVNPETGKDARYRGRKVRKT
jgi:hypothetical protein